MLEKFAQKDPSCVSYDEKLQFYDALSDEVMYIYYVHIFTNTYLYVHTPFLYTYIYALTYLKPIIVNECRNNG